MTEAAIGLRKCGLRGGRSFRHHSCVARRDTDDEIRGASTKVQISLRPDVSRTLARPKRSTGMGKRGESQLPITTPGSDPTSSADTSVQSTEPLAACTAAVAVTRIAAWNKSVPTAREGASGYANIRTGAISDPLPIELRPTA